MGKAGLAGGSWAGPGGEEQGLGELVETGSSASSVLGDLGESRSPGRGMM